MNETISQTLEPGAISSSERLQLIQRLKQEGFLCGVNAIPVLPFISDTEEALEEIISSAKQHDADYTLVGGLTLFGNNPADSKTLYLKFIERKFPHLISAYHQLYADKFYPPRWYQEELQLRVTKLCIKNKIRNGILEKNQEQYVN
jgi:DNA repair photolyase